MDKPTIPEVIDRFESYWYQSGNAAWGSLHVVLDDHNTQDCNVEWAIKYAEERGDTEGAELGRILLKMSRTQRRKISSLVWQRRRPSRRNPLEDAFGIDEPSTQIVQAALKKIGSPDS